MSSEWKWVRLGHPFTVIRYLRLPCAAPLFFLVKVNSRWVALKSNLRVWNKPDNYQRVFLGEKDKKAEPGKKLDRLPIFLFSLNGGSFRRSRLNEIFGMPSSDFLRLFRIFLFSLPVCNLCCFVILPHEYQCWGVCYRTFIKQKMLTLVPDKRYVLMGGQQSTWFAYLLPDPPVLGSISSMLLALINRENWTVDWKCWSILQTDGPLFGVQEKFES